MMNRRVRPQPQRPNQAAASGPAIESRTVRDRNRPAQTNSETRVRVTDLIHYVDHQRQRRSEASPTRRPKEE